MKNRKLIIVALIVLIVLEYIALTMALFISPRGVIVPSWCSILKGHLLVLGFIGVIAPIGILGWLIHILDRNNGKKQDTSSKDY